MFKIKLILITAEGYQNQQFAIQDLHSFIVYGSNFHR